MSSGQLRLRICLLTVTQAWHKLTSQMPHDPLLQPVSMEIPALSATYIRHQSDTQRFSHTRPYTSLGKKLGCGTSTMFSLGCASMQISSSVKYTLTMHDPARTMCKVLLPRRLVHDILLRACPCSEWAFSEHLDVRSKSIIHARESWKSASSVMRAALQLSSVPARDPKAVSENRNDSDLKSIALLVAVRIRHATSYDNHQQNFVP